MPRPAPATAALLPVALLVLTSMPVAAVAAPTASVLLPCHSVAVLGGPDEPVEVALAGGEPGATFRLLAARPGRPAGSAGASAGVYDADGDATVRIARLRGLGAAPSAGRTVQLAVQDAAGPAVPVAETLVAPWTVDVATSPSRPGARRVVRASGTPFAGARLSAFLVRAGSTKVLRRVSLGTADDCGHVRRSVAILPRGLRPGAYRVWVGAGTKLRRAAAVHERLRVR